MISFSFFRATDIAKWGIPCKKLVVPSIGSIIQKNFLFVLLIIPVSSEINE